MPLFYAHGHQCEKPYMIVFHIGKYVIKPINRLADGRPAQRVVEKGNPLLDCTGAHRGNKPQKRRVRLDCIREIKERRKRWTMEGLRPVV